MTFSGVKYFKKDHHGKWRRDKFKVGIGIVYDTKFLLSITFDTVLAERINCDNLFPLQEHILGRNARARGRHKAAYSEYTTLSLEAKVFVSLNSYTLILTQKHYFDMYSQTPQITHFLPHLSSAKFKIDKGFVSLLLLSSHFVRIYELIKSHYLADTEAVTVRNALKYFKEEEGGVNHCSIF